MNQRIKIIAIIVLKVDQNDSLFKISFVSLFKGNVLNTSKPVSFVYTANQLIGFYMMRKLPYIVKNVDYFILTC